MLKIDNKCKYPNVVAEMNALNMDYSELGDVLHTTAKTAKGMITKGSPEPTLEDFARLSSFFRRNITVELLAESELRTTHPESGADLSSLAIGMKQSIAEMLCTIEDNDIALSLMQEACKTRVLHITQKAEAESINHAEYRRLLDSIGELEKPYKRYQDQKEYNQVKDFVETQPQEAARKLLDMFNNMNVGDRTIIFKLAERCKPVAAV